MNTWNSLHSPNWHLDQKIVLKCSFHAKMMKSSPVVLKLVAVMVI